MKRSFVVALSVVGLIGTTLVASPAHAKFPGWNGQIAFQRFDPSTRDFAVYRVNTDGSHLQLVFQRQRRSPLVTRWQPGLDLLLRRRHDRPRLRRG